MEQIYNNFQISMGNNSQGLKIAAKGLLGNPAIWPLAEAFIQKTTFIIGRGNSVHEGLYPKLRVFLSRPSQEFPFSYFMTYLLHLRFASPPFELPEVDFFRENFEVTARGGQVGLLMGVLLYDYLVLIRSIGLWTMEHLRRWATDHTQYFGILSRSRL